MTKIDDEKYLDEVRIRIRKAYSKKGLRRPNKISPGEELRATVKRQRRAPQAIPNDIKLWLAFYDETVAFWLVVWATYRVQKAAQLRRLSKIAEATLGPLYELVSYD
ncbi:MAG: hypothetical protein KGK01_05825 [Bradyrhizobium sp.]|uniref:hypothetical protein n=1 Tax=Bradyrhizobium sp. TaxID=376 RepID=UPI001C29869F|nr:hypothetical protein [Bradyrhizobium sp.]MBU6463847.1 hypothetical protein [Pseudomonadota bacterium]MDE2067602.1 hypothetical protein [Bradyrhizobium sp.]MDE2241969.1 hypothetical protein [Bradyrhizobium sp.]MDE2473099.1 hypothetical protein [Bradyrhizobium sp.]